MKFLKIALVFGLLPVVLSSCMNKDAFPLQPVIKYKDFVQMEGDSARLIFSFTDGDGDLGVHEGDTLQSIFLKYFEKVKGQWTEPLATDVAFSYSIPYVTPTGRNKSIEGDMEVMIYPYFNPFPFEEFDAIKYQFYIVDRAGNKSNVVETPEIVIPE